jgi:hypothetical protein
LDSSNRQPMGLVHYTDAERYRHGLAWSLICQARVRFRQPA